MAKPKLLAKGHRPFVCLNMIVKNEAHVIEECLQSVVHLVDYYVIVDTGSTDNTREKITNFFKKHKIQGEIYNHDFRTCKCHGPEYKKYDFFHFGWNRTYAIEKALNKSEYLFFMDADDVVVGNLKFNKNLTADQYYMQFRTDHNSYNRPALVRNDPKLNWEYKDGLHEFLASPNQNLITHTIVGDYYINSRRLGDRNKDRALKYIKDCEFLEILMKERPDYPRYKHFYGQSLYDAREYRKAIEVYEEYIPTEPFEEAVYVARLMIGRCQLQMLTYADSKEKTTEEEMVTAFETCYKHHPEYAEPYYELTKYFASKNDYQRAYSYGRQVVHLKPPTNKILYVDKDLYDYRLLDELIFCASEIGEYQDAIKWSYQVLSNGKYPSDTRAVIEENIMILEQMDRRKFFENFSSVKKVFEKHRDKSWIAMYLGPSPMKPPYFGSEVAAINLCKAFLKQGYKVALFCDNVYDIPQYLKDDIYCFSSAALSNWAIMDTLFDLMIVSRYVSYFLVAPCKYIAKKTVMWLHDVSVHPQYNGTHLPNKSMPIVKNVEHNIDGFICSSPWHKNILIENYALDPEKIHVIGLGLNVDVCKPLIQTPKKPHTFIWVSDFCRGLVPFMEMFPYIRAKFPDAELHVYREIPEEITKKFEALSYIKFHGFADNAAILKAMSTCEYFVYITEWRETFCLSALEAQAMGCICLTSPLAALETTVGDRGILVERRDQVLSKLIEIDSNPEKKEELRKKAQAFALTQDWTAKVGEFTKAANIQSVCQLYELD